MKSKIKAWLHSLSRSDMMLMFWRGQVDRVQYEAYFRVSDWLTVRYCGRSGWKQRNFRKSYGKERYYSKINKVRACFGFPPIKEGGWRDVPLVRARQPEPEPVL